MIDQANKGRESRPVMLALVTDAFGQGGGIAQYNRDFLSAVASSFSSIEVLPRNCSDRNAATPGGITQHAAKPRRVAYALAAFALAIRTRPSVIFCGHLFMVPLATLLARTIGCQLVLQLHGIDAWDAPSTLHRWGADQADLILCVSRYTRARAREWLNVPPSRVLVLPNTVSDTFTPGDKVAARRAFGFDQERVLLSVTRLDKREAYKGIDRVIRALPALCETNQNLLYVVSGDGDDQPRLEALAKEMRVSDHVRFMGYVPTAELPPLFQAADLFVLPSTGEGFGIVFLEAMASGIPALGLAAGGAVDALGDGELGLTSTEDNLAIGLAASLDGAYTDGPALYTRVKERFGRPLFAGHAKALMEQLGGVRL